MIQSTNVFAALETLRKKKKSEKSSKSKGLSSKSQGKEAEEPTPVFWNPTPLTVKSWADVDDEDDDDYYATTAPIQPVWGTAESESKEAPVEESESEEDILDEGDEEVEEEHDQESEVQVPPEPEVMKAPEVSSAPKEAEKQLSKKELKKKDLAEFEAMLADFRVDPQTDNAQDELRDATKVKKDGDAGGVGDDEKKESLPLESKSAKKKKKKDKSSREVREPEDQPNSSNVTNGLGENAGAENAEEDASAMDVKERLKKMASVKKKKSNKELDGASKAAAIEAAARSAKLAAAKKKEKNHYNQQPVR